MARRCIMSVACRVFWQCHNQNSNGLQRWLQAAVQGAVLGRGPGDSHDAERLAANWFRGLLGGDQVRHRTPVQRLCQHCEADTAEQPAAPTPGAHLTLSSAMEECQRVSSHPRSAIVVAVPWPLCSAMCQRICGAVCLRKRAW